MCSSESRTGWKEHFFLSVWSSVALAFDVTWQCVSPLCWNLTFFPPLSLSRLSWSRVVSLVCRCHLVSICFCTYMVHLIAQHCILSLWPHRGLLRSLPHSCIHLCWLWHTHTHTGPWVCLQCILPLSWVWGRRQGGRERGTFFMS